MIRILDKVMRMISLTDHDAVIKHESIQDTVEDIINYSTYWLQFKEEEAAKSTTRPVQHDFPNYAKYSERKIKKLDQEAEARLTGKDISQMLSLTHMCTCQGTRETYDANEQTYCKNCKKVIATYG